VVDGWCRIFCTCPNLHLWKHNSINFAHDLLHHLLCDSGTDWSVNQSLPDSSSSERWENVQLTSDASTVSDFGLDSEQTTLHHSLSFTANTITLWPNLEKIRIFLVKLLQSFFKGQSGCINGSRLKGAGEGSLCVVEHRRRSCLATFS